MCGIAGIWNKSTEQPAERVVARMLGAMRHRGPDGEGTLTYPHGAAGMVRLALVDLSARGQQPIWSPDKRVAILFNGEIYNFREERTRLENNGYPFQSTTDTEVILALYLEQGMKFVDRLRGMYAIALFDFRETSAEESPTLILVRGPLGIKPLYVAEPWGPGRGVIFASEVRGVLATEFVPREVDPSGLMDFLSGGFVVQPKTMIAGVRMLEAGAWERYRVGHPCERTRYWSIPPYEPRRETLDQAAERLRAILDDSIRLHSLADAPVGAFLSGGIDSTGIVALMRNHVSDLRTYTLRYPEFPRHDESVEANETAQRLQCQHTTVDITGRDVAAILPKFVADLDQPSADGLNTWVVSQAAAHDVKAVLSGLGGDEWFAGYPVCRRMARASSTSMGRIQGVLGKVVGKFRSGSPSNWFHGKVAGLAARRSPLAIWMQSHSTFRSDNEADRMVAKRSPHVSRETEYEQLLSNLSETWRQETPIGLACLLDYRVYMQCQLLRDADAISMSHSLELRVPFVDLEVVNFSRSCADEFKLTHDGGMNNQYQFSGAKRVLIHSLRDVLPPSLTTRPKRGFALPIESWLRGPLFPIMEATTNPEVVAARGLIDPKIVEPYYRRRADFETNVRYPLLWTLCLLELWCQAVLDGTPKGAALAAAN